jgi:DNA-directed RNA polymerase subunit delta
LLEKEKSFINIAEDLLGEKQEPINLYTLFEEVLKKSGESSKDENKNEWLSTFYADLTSSAKFVYLGENEWDLKSNHDVSMWEKDGSFYSEYKEVYDEGLERRLEDQVKKEDAHQAMLEARKEKEAMILAARESQDSPALDMAENDNVPFFTEDFAEDLGDLEQTLEEDIILTEEDIEEPVDVEEIEEDDFDEEKYNEYMDEYEDQYEKE